MDLGFVKLKLRLLYFELHNLFALPNRKPTLPFGGKMPIKDIYVSKYGVSHAYHVHALWPHAPARSVENEL